MRHHPFIPLQPSERYKTLALRIFLGSFRGFRGEAGKRLYSVPRSCLHSIRYSPPFRNPAPSKRGTLPIGALCILIIHLPR